MGEAWTKAYTKLRTAGNSQSERPQLVWLWMLMSTVDLGGEDRMDFKMGKVYALKQVQGSSTALSSQNYVKLTFL